MSDTKNRNRNSNNEEVRKNQQIYDSIVKNCKGIPSAANSKIFYPEINNRIRSIMKTCPVELKTTVDINRRISSVTRMMEFQIALTHVTAITSFGESNRVGRITGFIKAELDTNLSKTEWKRLIEDMHHEKNPEWFSMWETTKVVCGKTSIVDNGLHDETANYGIFVSLFNKYKKKK